MTGKCEETKPEGMQLLTAGTHFMTKCRQIWEICGFLAHGRWAKFTDFYAVAVCSITHFDVCFRQSVAPSKLLLVPIPFFGKSSDKYMI